MVNQHRVSVLGDGGWGTALALVNVRNSHDVMLWSAFPEYAKHLATVRENTQFLYGVPLPPQLKITSELQEAVEFSDVMVCAVPTQYLRSVLSKISPELIRGKIFVSVAKGIEKGSSLRPSEIIREILGSKVPVVVLSGPSHAEEVARNIPTLVVAASEDPEHAKKIQQLFTDTTFRIYIQNDLIGAELGGALKNVIAIAAGVSDGLGYGANTKSGLVSRGLNEIVRFGVKLGALPNTFFGLSGLGDLMTTCFSDHGRNLRVGRELGQGKRLKDILAGMKMIAEGIDTAASVIELSRKQDVTMPICAEVYRILFEDKPPRQAVMDLLQRVAYEEWKAFS